jgi:serine protease 16
MLAAWSRLTFPHLIHAAVASSAPVGAVLNFQGYNDVVGDALADAAVGGDAACVAGVRAAFAQLGDALSKPSGRRRLEAAFPICDGASPYAYTDSDSAPEERPLDDPFAAAALSEELTYLFPAQGNDPTCDAPACNIAAVCAVMRGDNGSDVNGGAGGDLPPELTRLVRLAAMALPPGECMAAGRAAAAAALADTSLERGGERVWLWQTCTEVGFYQTCDPDSRCPFTSAPWLNNLSASLDICAMAFGDDIAARVASAVDATNEVYGGLTPGSTRVLYVNGRVDPWSAASIGASPGDDAPVLWVQGASHHAWTHPPRGDDAPQARDAPCDACLVVCVRPCSYLCFRFGASRRWLLRTRPSLRR